MNKIEWNAGLSVGVDIIDKDHKQLIFVINKLFEEIDKSASSEVLETIFEELENYTVYHFDHEEKLMYSQCSSTEDEAYIDAHVEQHKAFFENVPKLKKKLLTAPSKELAVEVVEFLATWLLEHIISEDLSFTEYFMKHEKILPEKKSKAVCDVIVSRLSNTIPLSKRAMLILLIPFIGFLLVSSFLGFKIYDKYNQLTNTVNITNTFVCINSITDNLQRERGLSNTYIASSQDAFKKELDIQREESSLKLNSCMQNFLNLYRYKNSETDTLVELFTIESAKIDEIREQIDTKSITSASAMVYYTKLIDTLIHIVQEAPSVTQGHIHLQPSLLLLLELKENSGLLRAEGAAVITQKREDRQYFKQLIASNMAYLKAFNSLSPQKFRRLMQEIEGSLNAQELQKIQENIVLDQHNIEAKIWFEHISIKILAYKQLVSTIVTTIDDDALNERNRAVLHITILGIIVFILFTLTFIFSFALKQSIIKPIEAFTIAMKKLASGDKSAFNYNYRADDAISDMIGAFENFRRSLIKADLADVLLGIQEHKAGAFEKLAHLDALTNTLNRRKFREVFAQVFSQAKSIKEPLSILALDLDKFKQINDNFGHDIGDSVLKEFVKVVQKVIRPSDYIARMGGEEFTVLLPDINEEGALEVANRILREVEKMDLSQLHKELKVTVSIGVSTCKEESSMDGLMKIADEKLYQSKTQGRNRVSV